MQRITSAVVEGRISTVIRVAAKVGVIDIYGGPVETMHLGGDSGTQRLYVNSYDDGATPYHTLDNGRGISSGSHTCKSGTYRELLDYLDGVLDVLISLPDVAA